MRVVSSSLAVLSFITLSKEEKRSFQSVAEEGGEAVGWPSSRANVDSGGRLADSFRPSSPPFAGGGRIREY